MSSSTLRRRLHHGDVDGRKNEHVDITSSDSLNEPLLGSYTYDNGKYVAYDDDRNQQDIWDDKKKEQLRWTYLFSNLIAQWAQWLANILMESRSALGSLLPSSSTNQIEGSVYVSPLQAERLAVLRQRLQVPFDGTCLDHQDALRQLWRLAFPNREIPPLKSELWKDMGWQGTDPSTDFRGGGFISLENLIYFAQHYSDSFQKLLLKEEGSRSEWEYPFAVAGINISFMLIQMLDLQSGMPTSRAGRRFLELLGQDESAFDILYCVAFGLMDVQWLARSASYMEFNEVLKSTRTQLERELGLEDVTSVQELPSYTILNR